MFGNEFILNLDDYSLERQPLPQGNSPALPRVTRKAYLEFPDIYEVTSPDGKWHVGLEGHDLFLRAATSTKREKLTDGGMPDYEWGALPWGLGAQWSADSRKLAVVRNDYRKTPKIPIVHELTSDSDVQWVPYPERADSPVQKTELFVIDIESKNTVKIDAGHGPFEHIDVVGWLPEGSVVFVARDRYYRQVRVVAANPIDGSTRELIRESHNTYFSRVPLVKLLSSSNRFLWMSPRGDWVQLYLYDAADNRMRQLTNGSFPVVRIVEVDETNGWVYFIACPDKKRPYDTHLCRVNFQGEQFTRLTREPGQHEATRNLGWVIPSIQFSPSKSYFIVSHSSPSRPPSVDLRHADGTFVSTLSEADVSDLMQELKWQPPEEFLVKAADLDTDLYGVLYKPYDFDSQKKYPVLLWMMGFTQHEFLGMEDLTTNIWGRALAQLGFVVVNVDTRGPWTGHFRGRAFAKDVYGTFGRVEVADSQAVLRQLGQDRRYMDLDRVGVIGYSFGGYFAVRAMLQAPETFHVGIAVAPVIEVSDHANYRWIGPLNANREEYEFASNLRLASNLKGKLMLIHGTADTLVPIRHTMKMVDALIRANKQHDLVILPEWSHWGNERTERYWIERCRRFLFEHLEP